MEESILFLCTGGTIDKCYPRTQVCCSMCRPALLINYFYDDQQKKLEMIDLRTRAGTVLSLEILPSERFFFVIIIIIVFITIIIININTTITMIFDERC